VRRRVAAGAVAAACLGVLSGCVSLPESGPVVEVEESRGSSTDTGGAAAIDARPPQEGQSAAEVVKGFLDAMQAWPTELATAKQFLASEIRSTWSPTGTIVYEDALPPSGGAARVEVRLGGASRLDARGAWQGELAAEDSILGFRLVTEDGEYRIADLPAALVVPETWFEQRYRRVALFFPDPSGSVLVPEPVFVGDDPTFASSLVSGLLRGPGRSLQGVLDSQLPSELRVDLSVPVTDGLAAISLTGEASAFSPADTDLLFAQLAWTLRQDPDVDAFTLEIDGRPVRTANGETRIPVAVGDRLDPVGFQTDSLLHGLRDGLLVSGTPGSLDPVGGVMGRVDLGVRSVAVDLLGTRVAAVSQAGGTVLLAPLTDGEGAAPLEDPSTDPGLAEVVTAAVGTDLLPPAWDVHDRLWLLDRTSSGAVVSWVQGDRSGVVEVPGITGAEVRDFLVSRDGTRLVAVVRGPRSDTVRVARIRSDGRERVVGASRSRALRLDDDPSRRIRDVAWTSTTTLAVLNRLTDVSAKVVTVGVDGSPGGLGGIITTLSGATALVGSPAAGTRVYAVTDTGLADLNATVRGPRVLDEGLTFVTYAG
jgi:hypothetical protein